MSDARQMVIRTPTRDELALVGEIDIANVAELRAALASLNGSGDVLLDLSGLTFIDSSGLHAIATYARGREGTVTLKHVSPFLARLLELTRLDELPNVRVDGGS